MTSTPRIKREPAQQTLIDRQASIQFKNVGILERVWLRGDNRNQTTIRDLERYYSLIDRQTSQVLTDLGADRMASIMERLAGFVATPDSFRLAWAWVDDHGGSPEEVAVVRTMPDAALWALVDAAERYNRTEPGRGIADRMAEAAIT